MFPLMVPVAVPAASALPWSEVRKPFAEMLPLLLVSLLLLLLQGLLYRQKPYITPIVQILQNF